MRKNYNESKKMKTRDIALQVINEAYDYFKNNQQIDITNVRDLEDVYRSTSLFEEYADQLSNNVSAAHEDDFRQLLENSKLETLIESSTSGIQPVASMTGSMLRVFFPKLVIKDSMPTEVATVPTFTRTALTPFYVKPDGTKEKLPDYYRNAFKNNTDLRDLPFLYKGVLPVSGLGNINLLTGLNGAAEVPTVAGYSDVATGNLSSAIVAALPRARTAKDKIDRKFKISKIRFSLLNSALTVGGEIDADEVRAEETLIDVPVEIILDQNNNLFGKVRLQLPSSGAIDTASLGGGIVVVQKTTTVGASGNDATNTSTKKVAADTLIEATILGHLDLQTGDFNLSVNGAGAANVVGAAVTAYLSSEYNNFSGSVTFEIAKHEVAIGTGEHINAPFPVEFLKDLSALYNIDGHLKIVDLMSTHFAHVTENEAWNFFKESFVVDRQGEEFYREFNYFPPREFAGLPKDWLEMLRRMVDHMASSMRNKYSYPGGYFVISGNPLDVELLGPISWSFNSQSEKMDGVTVNYSTGTYVGSNTYKVIASENIPQGELGIYFYPTAEDQETYKYYPYTFTVENAYRDPNAPFVPSLMMTKRHTFYKYTPLQGKIKILNNDGNVPPRGEFVTGTNPYGIA